MSWKVLEFLKGLRSSKGTKEVIKRSWNVLQCFEILRSSGLQKVLKRSTKSTKGQGKWIKGTQGTQTSGSQLILKMSSNSSKGHQSLRSPQRSTKGIQGDLNSSKSYQRPQIPVVVKGSSNVHQMVLKKSSKVPKNSPQKVHKRSSKGPEHSSMLWDPQVLRS